MLTQLQQTEVRLPGILPVFIIIKRIHLKLSQGLQQTSQIYAYLNVSQPLTGGRRQVSTQQNLIGALHFHRHAMPVPVKQI